MNFKPVAIAGYGIVSCVGRGADAIWSACVEGKSGIQAGGLGYIPVDILNTLAARAPANLQKSRAGVMAAEALSQAIEMSGWEQLGSDTGFILATTTGQIDRWDRALSNFKTQSYSESQIRSVLEVQTLGSLQQEISKAFQLKGPEILLTPACSAATQALALASLWIQTGRINKCVVGGVEILCDLTIEGFRSLRLLSSEICRPFDADRNGINLSEGSAFLCLERESNRAVGFVSGCGFSSDAYHMTAPRPEGQGLAASISQSLNLAQVNPGDLTWIHAHGTGSVANDIAECSAIGAALRGAKIPVVSTKAIHGHTLGACGAIEAIICLESIKNGVIPRSQNLHKVDPMIDVQISQENRSSTISHILKTTSGFGGNNCSVIISGKA